MSGHGPKLWLSMVFAWQSPLQLGWHIGVTNIPEPYIRCWINEVNLGNVNKSICQNASDPDDEYIQEQLNEVTLAWALVTAIYAIGATIGALSGGPLSDSYGRKTTMIGNSILGFLVSFLLGASRLIGNYWVMVVGRLLIGINTGIASTSAPVYINEIAPDSLKGPLGTSFQISAVTGILFAQITGLTWLDISL